MDAFHISGLNSHKPKVDCEVLTLTLARTLANRQIGMNRGLYTAATGMAAGQAWLDSVAHNLANASTTGYKRDEMAFQESLLREMRDGGGEGRLLGTLQTGPEISATATVFERGATQTTGNGLDVSISTEKGMFAVQTPGAVMYTRAGNFGLDDQRQIVNPNGFPVLDASGNPITVSAPGPVRITNDGSVTVGDQVLGKVAVFDGDWKKAGDSLFTAVGNVTAEPNAVLTPESIESSNVNVVSTMIEMVQVQRIYEMAQKSVQAHDEMSSKLIEAARTQ